MEMMDEVDDLSKAAVALRTFGNLPVAAKVASISSSCDHPQKRNRTMFLCFRVLDKPSARQNIKILCCSSGLSPKPG